MAERGLDPLPTFASPAEFAGERGDQLVLMSSAAHHFDSSSMGNLTRLMQKEGTPYVEINPRDAAERNIQHGDNVVVENARGWCGLRAIVTDDVPAGVLVSPKGQWANLSPGGRNINWVTPDALADLANQSTFHSNLVAIRLADAPEVTAVGQERVALPAK
jgi:anaerobic selenocysteine-containing dehydrogenase